MTVSYPGCESMPPEVKPDSEDQDTKKENQSGPGEMGLYDGVTFKGLQGIVLLNLHVDSRWLSIFFGENPRPRRVGQ